MRTESSNPSVYQSNHIISFELHIDRHIDNDQGASAEAEITR